MDIIGWAFKLVGAVERLAERARKLYHAVMLMGRSCSVCGGTVVMVDEGKCQCKGCGQVSDPTIVYQRCGTCGGKLELHVRKYRCKQCGAHVVSRFLFDGPVLSAEYFRQKMTESRRRKKEQRERVRKMLAESRSPALTVPGAELSSMPGLVDALDCLVGGRSDILPWHPAEGFNLKRYRSHIEAHIQDFPLSLREISSLAEDARKDLVWRFTAIIFMAHAGMLDVWQEGSTIWVMKHEADGKGQDILGDTEAVDGVEGSLGRAQA
ncbi:hypothetical protein ACFL09_03455 [Planctomycetota bacterium]